MSEQPFSEETGTVSRASERPAELSRHVAFTAETIHRSQIKGAPYNPRVIKEAHREKLKANLKRVGLIQSLVWNRRTGNLVSGHQRLDILDSLERSENYLVPVDVVDLSPEEEKVQNVALNNTDLMGEWDLVRMEELVKGGLDLLGAGLDVGQVAEAFGLEAVAGQDKGLTDLTELINASKDMHDKAKASAANKDEADYYRVVIFPGPNEAAWLSELCGVRPGDRFLDGALLRRRLETQPGTGTST